MSFGRRRWWYLTLLLCSLLLVTTSVASAQYRRFRRFQFATPASFDGAFQFCRVFFRTTFNGDGGDWAVDYPRADSNLMTRLSELTKAPIGRLPDGEPNHVIIRLTQPELFRCPFIMMTEVGNIGLDEAETSALRDYLLKGGFLWADD